MSKLAGKGDQQHSSPVFTQHQVPAAQVAVGRCSICSRPAFRPIPMQAEGKADAPPPQTPVSAQPTCYLKFKGCSEQIKGQKIADTICLGEANCKQFCYSAAFHLSADTGWIPLLGRSMGTGCTWLCQGTVCPMPCFVQPGYWQQKEDKRGGVAEMGIYTCAV